MNVQSTLQAAIAHHQAGRWSEAEVLYRQILARFPEQPDALHMLGLLAYHAGHPDVAVDLVGQAIRLAPGQAPAYVNLASALTALGRHDEAIDSCRRALAIQPLYPEAHLNLGNALRARGMLDEAVASYRQAAVVRRDYAEAHYNLGSVFHVQGKLPDAARSLRRALEIRPAYAEAHNALGNVLQAQGQPEQAITCYQRALANSPELAEALNNLGLALQATGRLEESIVALERAIAIRPEYADAHNNLGAQFEARGLLDQALACYRRALELKPAFPEACNNLGNLYQAAGRLEEALGSYRQALALRPDYAEAHNNLGNALQAAGLLDDAIRSHDQAIALRPDLADAWWNKAFALLLKGEYAAGWALFEWRWKVLAQHSGLRRFDGALWLGESSLDGRRLLLYHEQGLGDTLQMLRYVPLLAAQGARVSVEVPRSLASIAASVAGVAEVVVPGGEAPAYDLHCPFMSLPLACKTTLDNVPGNVPYLSATAGACAAWRERLDPGRRRRVGLAWSGSTTHRNDRQRSLRLQQLLPLLGGDAEFLSLQTEYRPADQALMAADGRVRDFSAELTDFAATAALIAQLELVITVDTAVAHLAGAMGKPVWLLLPFAPDYRWMLQRTDSPWYPTMRLFRQPSSGDWATVIGVVADALSLAPVSGSPAGP